MVIETLLIVSVAAFYLAVMTWCPWTNPFMADFKLITQKIERMYTVCFLNMCKFNTIVGLKYIVYQAGIQSKGWRVSKNP